MDRVRKAPAAALGILLVLMALCLHLGASMTSAMTQLAKFKLRAAGATVIYAANICPEFCAMAGTFTTPVTANQTSTAPLSTTPGKTVTASLDTTATEPPVPTFVHTSPNSTGTTPSPPDGHYLPAWAIFLLLLAALLVVLLLASLPLMIYAFQKSHPQQQFPQHQDNRTYGAPSEQVFELE